MVSRRLTFVLGLGFFACCLAASNAALAGRPGSARQPTLQVLHAFSGGADGSLPMSGLLLDKSGALFGVTEAGGAKNVGTVYRLVPAGSGYTESVLHSFRGGSKDGALPVAPLIEGRTGTLFGTTLDGGSSSASNGCVFQQYTACGTVFALVPSAGGYTERLVHRFDGGAADGRFPYGGMVIDASGALHGTTLWGVGGNAGTVFTLNSGGPEQIVYSFPLYSSGPEDPNGALPSGALAIDAKGAIYGTAAFGGDGACPRNRITFCGVVYALTPAPSGYMYSRLYSFQGGNDGYYPEGGIVADAGGALYGTTEYGGAPGLGTVFKLTPTASGYTESVLYAFQGGADGALPLSSLVLDKTGALYGTTSSGGAGNAGTIFKLTPSGSGYTERVLYAFTGGNDGADPLAPVILGTSRVLLGAASTGGAYGIGTVFALHL